MTSTESASSSSAKADTNNGPQPAANPTDAPRNRETPPDLLPSSVHNPGGPPGAHILTGPAEMTVGTRKADKGGKSGGGKSGSK